MRRTQVIALLLVAVMALTVVPASAMAARQSNPAPAAHPQPIAQKAAIVGQTPTLSTYIYPTWPQRGQVYTVYGYLSYSGTGLANKPIAVYWKYPTESTYHFWKWIWTDAYGYYQIGDAETSQRVVNYAFYFTGDSVYDYVISYRSYANGYTTTSLYSSNYVPDAGQQYYVYGYVRNGYGTGVYNVPVVIYYRYWTGSVWTGWYYNVVWTSSSGFFYEYQARSTYTQYIAYFYGYPLYPVYTYWYTGSGTINVDAR